MKGTVVELHGLRSPVIIEALNALKVKTTDETDKAQVIWWDGLPPADLFTRAKPFQRINKIPEADKICYKSTLFQCLNQMQILYPAYYHFFPRTLMLPHQFAEFQKEHIRLRGKIENLTWIFKPQNGCCGTGIRLVQSPFDVANESTPGVIQQYIEPYLLNGFKFDFRFYILITDLEPLTVFVYREGVARFCTEPYQRPMRSNLKERFCHITNTAVNVGNVATQNADFTRPASEVLKEIGDDALWCRIKNVCMLTICAIYPQLLGNVGQVQQRRGGGIEPVHRYFHILGIDILITENGDPCVLELNDRPSMKVTFRFERELKAGLVGDAMKIVCSDGGTEAEDNNGWERVLPLSDGNAFSRVVRSMKQRSLNMFGQIRSAPNLHAAKSIVYPKPAPDKTRIIRYKSHYF